MKLSATVITFNEERDLGTCLRSLEWCDEIVVVDSGSRDQTRKIAESHHARVIGRPFEGFSAQKNYAAQEAHGDWIFSVDADEVVTPELRDEITALLGSDLKEMGFYVPRRNMWLGKEIRHGGWYPDHTLRLYRRGVGQWEGHSHEKVVVTGSTGVLKGALVHRTLVDVHDHLRKGLLSAVLELKEAKANGLTLYGWFPFSVLWRCVCDFWSGPKSELGVRMIYKARVKNRVAVRWLLPLYPAFRFAYMYVLRGGFLDGDVGFWLAYNSAIVESMKSAKLWEHYVYHRGNTPTGEASLEDTRTLYRSIP